MPNTQPARVIPMPTAVLDAPLQSDTSKTELEGTDAMRDDKDSVVAQTGKWRFDGTINIPTMVTLVTAIVLVVSAGVGVYSSLKETINKNTYDILGQAREIADLRIQLASARAENDARQQLFRAEFRSDLKDIKDNIQTLMGQASHGRRNLQQWER